MKHPISAALLDHWLSIRRGRRVPDRNDLNPMALRGVLAFTFMLEVDEGRPTGRTYPVRVSGTRLDALFGRSVKDMRFTELWQRQDEWELRAVTEAALDEGAPAVVGGIGAPAGYPPIAVEMMMLPLRCRGRTHARLLCSLVPLTIPTWIGLHRIGPLGLTTWRLLDAGRPPSTLPQLAEPMEATTASLAAPTRRFTVIEGGRSTKEEPTDEARKLALRSP